MSILQRTRAAAAALTLLAGPASAAGPMMSKEAEVPAHLQFRRSVDVEGWVGATNRWDLGFQSGRVRVRLLDPEVNAFVGMLVSIHHFNQPLYLGDPNAPNRAGLLGNWGGVFGLVRGKHLWELDLQAAHANQRLGYAMALTGEHDLGWRFFLFHRTELNIFTVDKILHADQGLSWRMTKNVGISAGYRWFTSDHTDRSGPFCGMRLYFESPKIPFLFPSLG